MSTDENGTDNKSPFTSYSVKIMYRPSRVLCRIMSIFFSSVNQMQIASTTRFITVCVLVN